MFSPFGGQTAGFGCNFGPLEQNEPIDFSREGAMVNLSMVETTKNIREWTTQALSGRIVPEPDREQYLEILRLASNAASFWLAQYRDAVTTISLKERGLGQTDDVFPISAFAGTRRTGDSLRNTRTEDKKPDVVFALGGNADFASDIKSSGGLRESSADSSISSSGSANDFQEPSESTD